MTSGGSGEVGAATPDVDPALPEREPVIDPDCRDGKCQSCVGDPCEHSCHYDSRDADAGTWSTPQITTSERLAP